MDCNYVQEAAEYVRARIGETPRIGLILGSGLGYLGDLVEDAVVVPYGEIPHFKHSTAPGHKGQLVFGRLAGQPVAVMQGRVHHYEGYSYEEVSYGVRVLRLLGCDTLFVTNAAGGVNWKFQAGDLMLITDHIKIFMESPVNHFFLSVLPQKDACPAGLSGGPPLWYAGSPSGAGMGAAARGPQGKPLLTAMF